MCSPPRNLQCRAMQRCDAASNYLCMPNSSSERHLSHCNVMHYCTKRGDRLVLDYFLIEKLCIRSILDYDNVSMIACELFEACLDCLVWLSFTFVAPADATLKGDIDSHAHPKFWRWDTDFSKSHWLFSALKNPYVTSHSGGGFKGLCLLLQ